MSVLYGCEPEHLICVCCQLLPLLPGDEAAVAEQQQLLHSIHAMIGDLEAEKRSYLGMLDSSQVCYCLLPIALQFTPVRWL